MTELAPIACTLGPADLAERATEIRALGRDGLVRVERSERRAELTFRRDPALRARLDAIVAAESECCAFIELELSDVDDAIVLILEAPEGGEPAMHMLAELFVPASGVAVAP